MWITPDWPAPFAVRAVVTTRHGPGVSTAPFDRLNLGLRSGDAVEIVQANRGGLQQALALPAAPRWLRQIHGTAVAELGPLPTAGGCGRLAPGGNCACDSYGGLSAGAFLH